MRTSIKLIAILLSMTLLPLSFAGCFGSDRNSDSTGDCGSNADNNENAVTSEVTFPDPPENVDLNIIANGQSEYVIVYDSDVACFEDAGFSLSNYINDQFGVSLAVYSDQNVPTDCEKRIIIGDADTNAVFVKNKLNEFNDFAVDVCGDDLVLYAANEYLYDYLFEIAHVEFFTNTDGQTELVIPKDGGFIYHQSEYSQYNYAQYIKNRDSKIKFFDLIELFYTRTFTAEDGTVIPYRIYIPSNYDPKNQTTPLIVFFHGAGERGADNQSQLYNFMPDAFSLKDSPYAEAIIIAPQCPLGQQWVDTPWANGNYSIDQVKESNELGAVVELISEIEKEYRPDADRYYAIGLSMGGFATWDIIMRHPELFAAAMPICGGGDSTQAESIKNIPIWTVHGTSDSSVPYSGTAKMSEALALAGSTVFQFTSLSGYSHNVWSLVGNDRAYGEWLLGQSKSKR